jgi:hypothetical protein
MPTKSPTPAPTLFPTLYPTPEATNPEKPVYDESQFADISVSNQAKTSTSYPTKSPTAVYVPPGHETEQAQVSIVVIETEVTFPVSASDLQNDPTLETAVETGVANSLGLDREQVTITGVTETRRSLQLIERSRRLAASQVKFDIESNSDSESQVNILQANIAEAATEGSIVAHVQRAAMENGVLTERLASMERSLTVLTKSTSSTKIVTVVKLAPTKSPTKFPTDTPTKAPTTPTKAPTTRTPTKAPITTPAVATPKPTKSPTPGPTNEVLFGSGQPDPTPVPGPVAASGSSGLGGGAIAGIVIGALAGVALLGGGTYMLSKSSTVANPAQQAGDTKGKAKDSSSISSNGGVRSYLRRISTTIAAPDGMGAAIKIDQAELALSQVQVKTYEV